MPHNGIRSSREKIQERVAIEIGYEKELVKEVLHQISFDCSANLVDYLFQLNSAEIKNLRQAYYNRLEKEEVEKRCLEEKTQHVEKEEKLCLKEKMQRAEKEMEGTEPESLRHETRLLYLNSKCLNCFINLRNMVTLPCSHLYLCERCSERVDKCPSCKESILCTIKTFRS